MVPKFFKDIRRTDDDQTTQKLHNNFTSIFVHAASDVSSFGRHENVRLI